jgi:hypothetical protein
MPRLLLNGTVPSKDDLLKDDLIKQMVDEAKAGSITKESVIQSLTVIDIPEGIKTELTKDIPTKDTVLQSLTIEDVPKLPEPVRQKILEDAKVIPSSVETFVKAVTQLAKIDTTGSVNDTEGGKKKSVLRQMREERAELGL